MLAPFSSKTLVDDQPTSDNTIVNLWIFDFMNGAGPNDTSFLAEVGESDRWKESRAIRARRPERGRHRTNVFAGMDDRAFIRHGLEPYFTHHSSHVSHFGTAVCTGRWRTKGNGQQLGRT
jgi:hypothetical protein